MKKLILILSTATAVLFATAHHDAKLEKDVLAALESWKQATIHKDRAGFEKVYHSDLKYGHPNGLIETKAQAIKHSVEGKAAASLRGRRLHNNLRFPFLLNGHKSALENRGDVCENLQNHSLVSL